MNVGKIIQSTSSPPSAGAEDATAERTGRDGRILVAVAHLGAATVAV